MPAALFHAPDDGRPLVQLCEVTVFLNALMFQCAVKPGLSAVLLSLLNFEVRRLLPFEILHRNTNKECTSREPDVNIYSPCR